MSIKALESLCIKPIRKILKISKVELVWSIVHRTVSNSVAILIAILGLAAVTENINTLFLEKG